ncbi:MAG TPA: nuclear transport factor 2 family protein [Solirubrobacteraceae bacterium]|nr:nuclear transport factor 2 family protein [Solirubrobacteraceae bacterium]
MSQEIEVVRALFEAFNRQDASAVAELWTPGGDWRPAFIGGGQLEGAVFRGPEGMAKFVEVQSETWESVRAEPVKLRALGDNVLVEVHLSAVGRGSGVPVDVITWNVFAVLDGKLISGAAYTSEETALEAVGLEE